MPFFSPTAWTPQGKPRVPRLPQCGRCGLFRTCQSPKMAPTGEGKRKILFVAEAPGEQEDETGEQLVGKSGQLLRRVLAAQGLELDDCLKTNSIICRPPKNEITDLHIESCRPNLLKTIRENKPRVIVLLGASAVKALLPMERDEAVGSITKWTGWTIPSHEHQAWIVPTWHPSYLLRLNDPVLDLLFKQHLRTAIKLENKPLPGVPLEKLREQVEIVLSLRDARLKLRDLSRAKGILAFDYETTGKKPDSDKHQIVSSSFCLDGEGTWATMLHPDLHTPLRRVLWRSQLRKVGSNIKYEDRWTRARLRSKVRGWHWDTMLAAHTLDNRTGVTGLKFQSFVQFGIADYDSAVDLYLHTDKGNGLNRIHEIPPRDLLLYNGLDSLLTHMLYEKQRRAFK